MASSTKSSKVGFYERGNSTYCHFCGAGTPPLDPSLHLFALDPERSETIKLETSMEEGLQQFACPQMQQG